MDTKILQEIGLTDSEIKVYLALLELGSCKKGPLVKKAGITSSKVYEVVDKLIEKGLASHVTRNRVRYFNAAPPSRIKDYLLEKEGILKQQERELEKVLPVLEAKKKLAEREVDAEIFSGWKGMQTVYNDVLESLKKGDAYYVFGASKGADEEKVRLFFTRFNQKIVEKGLKGHIIFNANARGNIPNVEKSAMVRYMEQTTPTEILIYGDKTAIVLLEKEPIITLIKGESVAKSFKEYFDAMWRVAKP